MTTTCVGTIALLVVLAFHFAVPKKNFCYDTSRRDFHSRKLISSKRKEGESLIWVDFCRIIAIVG